MSLTLWRWYSHTQFNTTLDLHMPFNSVFGFTVTKIPYCVFGYVDDQWFETNTCQNSFAKKNNRRKEKKYNSYVRRNVNIQQISVVVNENVETKKNKILYWHGILLSFHWIWKQYLSNASFHIRQQSHLIKCIEFPFRKS